MQRGHEGSRGHSGVPVNDGLLHVSLNRLNTKIMKTASNKVTFAFILKQSVPVYHLKHHRVSNGAEGSDGGGPVAILLARHVLGQAGGHDDHILGDVAQLLDAEVDQPPEHRVPGLEQLGDRKEAFCSLCSPQGLPLVDEIQDLSQHRGALPGVHRGLIEQPVMIGKYQNSFQLLSLSQSFILSHLAS